MISEWFLNLSSTVWVWFAELFPTWQVPAFLSGIDETVNSFMSNAAGIGAWIDWTFWLVCVGVVISVWVVGLTVKIALRVAAYLPFIGGAG